MAGLGEAASIAGIISLAGQTLQATSTLYTFCKTYRNIHIEFEQTSKELEGLRNILQQIERFATDDTSRISLPTDAVSGLQESLSECRKDIEMWAQKVELLGIADAKGAKRVLTKIKVSADKDYFKRPRERLCIHRAQIGLSLGLLGG
jgi:hypothetical protein